jgi:hypothetical protein
MGERVRGTVWWLYSKIVCRTCTGLKAFVKCVDCSCHRAEATVLPWKWVWVSLMGGLGAGVEGSCAQCSTNPPHPFFCHRTA